MRGSRGSSVRKKWSSSSGRTSPHSSLRGSLFYCRRRLFCSGNDFFVGHVDEKNEWIDAFRYWSFDANLKAWRSTPRLFCFGGNCAPQKLHFHSGRDKNEPIIVMKAIQHRPGVLVQRIYRLKFLSFQFAMYWLERIYCILKSQATEMLLKTKIRTTQVNWRASPESVQGWMIGISVCFRPGKPSKGKLWFVHVFKQVGKMWM